MVLDQPADPAREWGAMDEKKVIQHDFDNGNSCFSRSSCEPTSDTMGMCLAKVFMLLLPYCHAIR